MCGSTLVAMPRVRVLLVAFLAIVAAACCTACGGKESGNDRGDVAAATWAERVCGALGPWRGEIDALMARAQQRMDRAANADQAKTGLLELLGGAEQASEQARAKVAAAGLPDAANGKRAAAEFTDTLRRTRDAYGKAKETVDDLPTVDSKAFYDAVGAAFGQLDKDYGEVNLDRVNSPELRKAFDEVPACKS
jgi:hypothetical protein